MRRLLVFLAMLLVVRPLRADMVAQLNLRALSERAASIFRGTVVAAIPGTVVAGGGEIPVLTYRIRVDESFKGEFEEVKGARFAELRMLAGLDRPGSRLVMELPRLEIGQTYLLLTTQPSAIGMSTTVGLGQGLFHIRGTEPAEEAVNELGNAMLFSGMESRAERNRSLKYSELADELRVLAREGRQR